MIRKKLEDSQSTNKLSSEIPLISIIVPVYKTEKYLAHCLDSVLTQTFSDFEIICVNDGSPDGSAEILSNYGQQDERIKIITQENTGLSIARNNGVLASKGKYILYLDSDDTLHPQTLAILAYIVERKNSELVVFNSIKYFEDENSQNNFSSKKYISKNYTDFSQIETNITSEPLFFLGRENKKFRIAVTACGKLFKRELLSNVFFIAHIRFEDTPYVVEVLSKNPKTVILEEKLYIYTQHPQSIMHGKYTTAHLNDHLIGFKKIHAVLKNSDKEIQDYIARALVFGQIKHQLKKLFRVKKCRNNVDNNSKSNLEHAFLEQLKFLDSIGWLKLQNFRPENLYWYARLRLFMYLR